MEFILSPAQRTSGKNKDDDVLLELAKEVLKKHKKKAKLLKLKSKRHHFTFLETAGILFICSWPIYYAQKFLEAYLTYEVNHFTQQIINGPH